MENYSLRKDEAFKQEIMDTKAKNTKASTKMTHLQIQETAIATIQTLIHTSSNYAQIERQIIYQIHSHSYISTKEDFIKILHLVFESIIICPKCQKVCNKYETLNGLCLHCLTNL